MTNENMKNEKTKNEKERDYRGFRYEKRTIEELKETIATKEKQMSSTSGAWRDTLCREMRKAQKILKEKELRKGE